MDVADKKMIDLCKKVPEHVLFATEEYDEAEKQRIPAAIVFYHLARQFIPELIEERDRAIALLKYVAKAKERVVNFRLPGGQIDPVFTIRPTLESVQRHVRQKLEEWGIKVERSDQE